MFLFSLYLDVASESSVTAAAVAGSRRNDRNYCSAYLIDSVVNEMVTSAQ